ncbi:hypothetical protein [Paraflavitalea sp. CAU 1676]|uniref:hypothetical protein n=1 Tax=Paraflavitalea sp. CAU 1676 TaxID=3032598 RepID=UPI0023DC9D09|nr:hypothetical protein [Paraflavitalea sp. CAU 1676]MDF2189294.1 hypothetical protein [Paraflavitalea sp. CAU 1676]
MQPFLEVPMCLANSEKKEKVVMGKCLPTEIAYYYPGFYNGVVVVTKSGQSFLLALEESQFEAMLEAYSKMTKSNTGKFGILRTD